MTEDQDLFQKAAEEMAARMNAPALLNPQQERLAGMERDLIRSVRYWAECSVALDNARKPTADPRGVYPAAQANRNAEKEVHANLGEVAKLTKQFVEGGEMFPDEVGL